MWLFIIVVQQGNQTAIANRALIVKYYLTKPYVVLPNTLNNRYTSINNVLSLGHLKNYNRV